MLRFTLRKGRVYPGYLDPRDPVLLDQAAQLLGSFQNAPGQSQETIEASLDAHPDQSHPSRPGLIKLLWDRCEMAPNTPEAAAYRWEVLQTAEILRLERVFPSYLDYRQALGETLGVSAGEIETRLYEDLPDRRPVATYRPFAKPEDLIHRYNLALVQGLLIYAKKVNLEVGPMTLGQRRGFFRHLRFSQLIAQVSPLGQETYGLELSGPLSLFDGGSGGKYGLRFAQFFPHCLHFSEFSMEALITPPGKNKKEAYLSVDPKSQLKSHYESSESYVPEEFHSLVDDFSARYPDKKLLLGEDFLDLGHQSYCFPDFTLETPGGRLGIELFHPWHGQALKHRLDALAKEVPGRSPYLKGGAFPLFLGVSESLLKKNKDLMEQVEKSPIFKTQGFRFRDFPTCKQLALLNEV